MFPTGWEKTQRNSFGGQHLEDFRRKSKGRFDKERL
jgi:hypothetical protein